MLEIWTNEEQKLVGITYTQCCFVEKQKVVQHTFRFLKVHVTVLKKWPTHSYLESKRFKFGVFANKLTQPHATNRSEYRTSVHCTC